MIYTESDIKSIVSYLEKFKDKISEHYTWKTNFDRLIDLNVFSASEIKVLEDKNDFEQSIVLKKKLECKLNDTSKRSKEDFYKLCLWLLKDWGGITASEESNRKLIDNYFKDKFEQNISKLTRIASVSKILGFLNSKEYIIYDARIAYSLNWILLSKGINKKYFPMPLGRNSKMMAFNINVLIRLFNIDRYKVTDEESFKNKQFLNKIDKQWYIGKSTAYDELNQLVKRVNQKLWDDERKVYPYYTEMLLFAIADTEIYKDITKRISIQIYNL